MTEYVLGNVLKEMYETAQTKEQTLNIRLFGIYYAGLLEHFGKTEILKIAGLSYSYQAEINKGVKLAKYVNLNEAQNQRIQDIESKYEL